MTSIRRWTPARVAIGRAGAAVRTAELLDFQLAHARARDAIHLPWPVEEAARELREAGHEVVVAATAAQNRGEYLKRPDLGRRLSAASREALQKHGAACDVAVVISNGLSSSAVMTHAFPVAQLLLAALKEGGFSTAPIVLVPNGRVALSDEIGELLQAKLVLMLVGERPGLSSADSLAVYMTYGPKSGNTDAGRNCISNIRGVAGLGYQEAVSKAMYLVTEAFRRGYAGVMLKDETLPAPPPLLAAG
jgi:ethanolamine ammonia-lyase small subunit